jgi:hypothetical protein
MRLRCFCSGPAIKSRPVRLAEQLRRGSVVEAHQPTRRNEHPFLQRVPQSQRQVMSTQVFETAGLMKTMK